MNWYLTAGRWRLQWIMEDIQDSLDSGKTLDNPEVQCQVKEFKRRLQTQKITPEKQRNAALKFYESLGRGCPWNPNHDEYEPGVSVDARLLGCACCGYREFDNISNPMRKYNRVPLTTLDALKLSNKDAVNYEKKLKISFFVPTNERGNTNYFFHGKLKAYFHPK